MYRQKVSAENIGNSHIDRNRPAPAEVTAGRFDHGVVGVFRAGSIGTAPRIRPSEENSRSKAGAMHSSL